MMHHHTKFDRSEILSGQTFTEVQNLHCDLDLEYSKATFSQDTPAYEHAPSIPHVLQFGVIAHKRVHYYYNYYFICKALISNEISGIRKNPSAKKLFWPRICKKGKAIYFISCCLLSPDKELKMNSIACPFLNKFSISGIRQCAPQLLNMAKRCPIMARTNVAAHSSAAATGGSNSNNHDGATTATTSSAAAPTRAVSTASSPVSATGLADGKDNMYIYWYIFIRSKSDFVLLTAWTESMHIII